MCVKSLEKGIKLAHLNEYINKSSNFHGDYFSISKNSIGTYLNKSLDPNYEAYSMTGQKTTRL